MNAYSLTGRRSLYGLFPSQFKNPTPDIIENSQVKIILKYLQIKLDKFCFEEFKYSLGTGKLQSRFQSGWLHMGTSKFSYRRRFTTSCAKFYPEDSFPREFS